MVGKVNANAKRSTLETKFDVSGGTEGRACGELHLLGERPRVVRGGVDESCERCGEWTERGHRGGERREIPRRVGEARGARPADEHDAVVAGVDEQVLGVQRTVLPPAGVHEPEQLE